MSFFSIKYPFFILMICLIVVVVGITMVFRMPYLFTALALAVVLALFASYLLAMALALEPGSEQCAPLACAILGGLSVSGLITAFLVPTEYLLIHRNDKDMPARGTAW